MGGVVRVGEDNSIHDIHQEEILIFAANLTLMHLHRVFNLIRSNDTLSVLRDEWEPRLYLVMC